MEGAVRLFAFEFNKSTLTVPAEDEKSAAWVVIPSGVYCRQVFLSGVLTELHEEGDMLFARLADPTGGFDLVCGGKNTLTADTLRKIPRPSFIEFSGRVQVYRKDTGLILSIRPEHVRLIDRQARDQWVLATARATISRLELVRLALRSECTDDRVMNAVRHYQVTPAVLDDMAATVEGAVMCAAPTQTCTEEQPDARLLIIELLKARPGPRGVSVQEIIELLGTRGVFQDVVLKAVEALIVDDECYQPQKGFIRLL